MDGPASYLHERHTRAAAAGLCIVHTGVPVVPGKRRCQKCLDYAKDRREEAKEKQLCRYCRKVRAVTGICPKCREKVSQNRKTSLYGLTQEQYDKLYKSQDSRCGSCQKRRPLHIDHDHRTRAIRGLLCGQCNRALGLLGDDPVIIRRLATYIEVPL